MSGLVIWSHGAEAPPWGTKSIRLAAIANEMGFEFQAPDFTDLSSPDDRTERLAALIDDRQPDVLAGSSMGGYASLAAGSNKVIPGLFLLAPALYMPGYAITEFSPKASAITVIHGWRDEVVPVENSIHFASKHLTNLHIIDADHRLAGRTNDIAELFRLFLASLPSHQS
ncbi:alpha/beta hydrolase [Desulfovibrio oxyclinae]|uniref:alpha/beta hydrolase n=1 Tax=Desulfovibrio oxyclinae TaxID=63560 RepID=UPI000367EEC4|nr:alpha/beta hydrolase [Desulfovibrio oxyclinae]